MSQSLRDQLLQAGLVTEKQVKQASQQARPQQQPKSQRGRMPENQRAVQQAQAEKAARDQALNRRKQEQAERKARLAQVRQLVEQSRVPKVESDDYFNFVDGGKIRRVAVNAAMREQLDRGDLVIVRCDAHYELVPVAAAERIREREPSAIISITGVVAPVSDDDAYREYVVPDDLKW